MLFTQRELSARLERRMAKAVIRAVERDLKSVSLRHFKDSIRDRKMRTISIETTHGGKTVVVMEFDYEREHIL